MCDTYQHPDPVQHLVKEWEHGAMSRREFFERAHQYSTLAQVQSRFCNIPFQLSIMY